MKLLRPRIHISYILLNLIFVFLMTIVSPLCPKFLYSFHTVFQLGQFSLSSLLSYMSLLTNTTSKSHQPPNLWTPRLFPAETRQWSLTSI